MAHVRGHTLLLTGVAIVIWSTAYAGIRAALLAYSPGHLLVGRFLVTSAVLAVYAGLTRMRLPAARDLPGVLLAGVLGVALSHVTLTYGEVTVTAGATSLLMASVPAFTALLALLFLHERLRIWGWLGIAASFAGVALIALGEGEGLQVNVGAFLILGSAMTSGVYTILQKRFLRKYSPLSVIACAIWAGTFCLLIFAPGLPQAVSAAPLEATLGLVYLGIFPAALCSVLWGYVLQVIPASTAGSFLYLIPVLAVPIAWVWLGERSDVVSMLGGVVALLGVAVVQIWGRTREEALVRPGRQAARLGLASDQE